MVHIWSKFHLHVTCNSQQKIPFHAVLLGDFLEVIPPKFGQLGQLNPLPSTVVLPQQ